MRSGGSGCWALTKAIVVVDEHVNVHDYEEVFFRVGANVDPKRDVLLSEGPLDHLDHAPTQQFYGGKIGIDATHEGAGRGHARRGREEIEMTRGGGTRRPPLGRIRHRESMPQRRNAPSVIDRGRCYERHHV